MKKCIKNLLTLLLLLSTTTIFAQNVLVSGTITDTNNEPLIGVNVQVKGTTIGTVTDMDGKYSLQTPGSQSVLVFSYVGFLPQEFTVGNQSTINVTLRDDTQALAEVVVVGYGVQKKANLTGAVSTVKYDQALENRPITNASQALSGKITGVWASQNSGRPGDDGSTIRIRGFGTMNDANPMVLIDGIEGRFNDVNPGDIASITVLKDAASAAIYGSRAANGVILIETKRGTDGQISINYNGYVGWQQLGKRYDIVTNSADYMTLWNQAFMNQGSDPLFPQDVIDGFRNGTDPYRYPSTNYFDEIFRQALTTQHNVSANFGNNRSTTFMSLSYMKQDGIYLNTNADRFTLTVNNELKANDWLRFGVRARLMRGRDLQPFGRSVDNDNGIGGAVYMMAVGHPFTTPYLQDGKTYGGTQALYVSGDRAGQPIVDTRNPFPDIYNGKNEGLTNFMRGNAYAILDIMEGLSLTIQYNAQATTLVKDRWNQTATCYTDLNGSNPTKPLDYPSVLHRVRTNSDTYYDTFFANLNFDRTFNEIHEISAMAGYQQEGYTRKTTEARKTDPPKENLLQVSSGALNPVANGNMYQFRMISYFGRVNYALMGKYLMEVNMRADASSRFAKGNRWGYFPSFSAGWRIGEESFIKNMNVFDNLKLRASWGKLGNQNIGSSNNSDYFPYLTVLTQDYPNSYNFSNTLAPGAAVTALVDPNITWETTTTTDIGIDIGVLNNRLNIEADYFYRKTTDIIVSLPIPSILGGLTAPRENVGEMYNQGLELALNWQDRLSSSGLNYNLGANITYVKNEVTKFRGNDSPDQLRLIREGYSYRSLYGFIAEGIYQSNEEARQHMHSNGYMPVAGDVKYKDVNGDGRLDYQDKDGM